MHISPLLLSAAFALCMWACSHDHASEEQTEHPEDHDSEEIVVTPEVAHRFGVEVMKAESAPFKESVKVTGQVLPATSGTVTLTALSPGTIHFSRIITPGAVVTQGMSIASISSAGLSGGDPNAVSASELKAAQAELDRITPLYKEGVVSGRDYAAAKAAVDRARAAHSGRSGGASVVSPISGVITQILVPEGSYVDAGTPVATVTDSRKLVLRADLPEKYFSRQASFTSANISTAYSDSLFSIADHGGGRVDINAQTVGVNAGFIPLYFSFDNDGTLIPGSYVDIYLLGSEDRPAITLPVGAIAEQQGQYFVYTRIDDHGYLKLPVTLGLNDGRSVEILSGVEPGQEIVVSGVTAIRLAEVGDAVPEGHSHNH